MFLRVSFNDFLPLYPIQQLRLLALLTYWLVSAAVLCRLLLALESTPQRAVASMPTVPQPILAVRKLFRHHSEAGAELERAGFRPPRIYPSNEMTLQFFNLSRRQRLAATQPESPVARVLQQNSRQLDFHFRLSARPCRSRGERILVVVMTTARATDRRNAIRQTWATLASRAEARVIFLAAASSSKNDSKHLDQLLTAENARYGDIVLVPDFTDTYRHLTLKVLAALDFACRRCPQVRMLAKVDDDSVLNLPALRHKWLDKHERQFPGLQYVAGYRYETPIVRRRGRWQVSKNEYPFERFPSYMFGGAYALRVDTCGMFAAARYFPVPPIEDAFITGVLPAALGIRQGADNAGFACQFFNHAGSLNVPAFRSGLVMSGTDLTPRRMRGFWKRLVALENVTTSPKLTQPLNVTLS